MSVPSKIRKHYLRVRALGDGTSLWLGHVNVTKIGMWETVTHSY